MTTVTALPTPWAALHAALDRRVAIHVTYHGRTRLLCPHALGVHGGRPIVLGYQTGGDTSTGHLHPDPRKRWRWLYVDEIDHIDVAHPTSPWQTADNYNPAHPFPHDVDEITIAITG